MAPISAGRAIVDTRAMFLFYGIPGGPASGDRIR
jgi:hypothetical protein